MVNNAQRINQTSGNVEYYTDPTIVNAARLVMGGIDLDPFSCRIANEKFVQADQYFTKEDDGLKMSWFGKVWMNHPFGRKTNKPCIQKLWHQYHSGTIKQACCITFAATSEAWFRPLLYFPQCFLSPRTNYYNAQGEILSGVTKGSVVTYLGPRVNEFKLVFQNLFDLGVVKV